MRDSFTSELVEMEPIGNIRDDLMKRTYELNLETTAEIEFIYGSGGALCNLKFVGEDDDDIFHEIQHDMIDGTLGAHDDY